jgi:hypothetical protein
MIDMWVAGRLVKRRNVGTRVRFVSRMPEKSDFVRALLMDLHGYLTHQLEQAYFASSNVSLHDRSFLWHIFLQTGIQKNNKLYLLNI